MERSPQKKRDNNNEEGKLKFLPGILNSNKEIHIDMVSRSSDKFSSNLKTLR